MPPINPVAVTAALAAARRHHEALGILGAVEEGLEGAPLGWVDLVAEGVQGQGDPAAELLRVSSDVVVFVDGDGGGDGYRHSGDAG